MTSIAIGIGKIISVATFASCLLTGSSDRQVEGAVRSMTLAGLTTRSDSAVVGTVTGVESRWTKIEGVGRVIVTDVRLSVREWLFGRFTDSAEIRVQLPGGTVGDLTLFVSDAPVLRHGESVLLFLKGKGPGQPLQIYGLHHGKYALDGDRIVTEPGLVLSPERRSTPFVGRRAEGVRVEVSLSTGVGAGPLESPLPASAGRAE